MTRRALITGITGQDGSYLAEHLVSCGYEVFGLVRRSSSFNTQRIDHLIEPGAVRLLHGDITDPSSITAALNRARPDELYNLAAQSHVRASFDIPMVTMHATGLGALNVFEAARLYRDESGIDVRVYQASSSEQFGNWSAPQSSTTPFDPCSPYAVSKVMAHHAALLYRQAHKLRISCGILFNHESPRRGETFVTRKITRAVGRIQQGLQKELRLGNLDARRDWGHAADYVRAMHQILQAPPGDHVIGTGVSTSVHEFARKAFNLVGLDADDFIVFDPRYLRPVEVNELRADTTRGTIDFTPSHTLDTLVEDMVQHDLALAEQERYARDRAASGHATLSK